MNRALILKSLGALLVIVGGAMLIPMAVSLYFGEADSAAFTVSIATSLAVGLSLFFVFRNAAGQLRSREAFLLVGFVWLCVTLIGAVPYYISGAVPSVIDAWFESMSGFTTTGATVIPDVEGLSKGMLLWRSLTQYLGGMGIIVLSLAVLPLLGVGGMDLFQAEAPGPTTDKISSRMSETARALWMLYLSLMIIEVMVLVALGMGTFDAFNHAMTTMASGGFSTKNNSIAGFDSASVEWAVTFFMFLAGINFLLIYRLIMRRDGSVFRSSELRFYITLVVSATVLLTLYIWGKDFETFGESFRHAAFQVVSIGTTTGYGTADYEKWGAFAQMLLVLLMVIGGCAGSTAGGVKCVRALMLIKQGARELYLMIHPKAVSPMKVDGKRVSDRVASAVFGYFFLYIVLLATTGLFLTAFGLDLTTAVSTAVSALSNIGPALGEAGPALHYGTLPDTAKFLLSCCMLIGRLELFTILVLFTGEFWRS